MSQDELVGRIREALGDAVESVEAGKKVVHLYVSPSRVVEAARKLKDMGFDHVKDVTAIEYPKENTIVIVYHLSSYGNLELSRHIVGLAYKVPRDTAKVPSLYNVWTTADFQEREVYEGFGIIFEGHPDMRPVLLSPPVAALKPLRKDYVVKEDPINRT